MKHINYLFVMICTALMMTGCSNEFEDIFNGNNKDAIAPIELSGKEGESISGISYSLMRATMLDILDTLTDPDGRALVINSQEKLRAVVQEENAVVGWPEINFDKYSLVLGCVFITPLNRVLDTQRMVIKRGVPKLYVKIKISDGAGSDTCVGASVYFVKLYPKVQFEAEMEINTWQTY